VREYVLTLLVAAAITYLLTPLVRRGAIRVGAVRVPRSRDVHAVPVPLLGGLAMFGGLAAGLIVASRLTPLRGIFADTRIETGLLLAGGLIVLIGVVDDRWGMGPISKLAGQVAAAAILAWQGVEIGWLPEPGGGTLILSSHQQIALTILVVVATINAVNFIDGLDGLAAGIVLIAAVSFFIYYYTLTEVVNVRAEDAPALASAILAGICLGFLPHNFYPARIFMGDTGAMLLGLLLAYAPISSISVLPYQVLTNYSGGRTLNRFPEVLPLLLPAVILVIPYADMLLAIVRRTRAGLSPFAPDRKHLHHRLLDIGHSHRSSVLIMYLWATLFSGTVIWLSIARTQLFVFALTTLGAAGLLLLMSMPRLRWWRRGRAQAPVPENVALAAASVPVADQSRLPAAATGPDGVDGTAVPAVADAAPDSHPSAASPGAAAGHPAEVPANGRPASAQPANAAPRDGQPAGRGVAAG
jgi:UDP-GlcNAc:undecaprenyl-phosphate/decaprenyl-phosphate GlcNAc-1-phosphate transferase